MSRCSICDTLLSRCELAIRYNAGHELSDNFVDMCTSCLTDMSEEEPMFTTNFNNVVISNYSSNDEVE